MATQTGLAPKTHRGKVPFAFHVMSVVVVLPFLLALVLLYMDPHFRVAESVDSDAATEVLSTENAPTVKSGYICNSLDCVSLVMFLRTLHYD